MDISNNENIGKNNSDWDAMMASLNDSELIASVVSNSQNNLDGLEGGAITSKQELIQPDGQKKKFYCKNCKKEDKLIELILSSCKALSCPLKRHKEQNNSKDKEYLQKNCHIQGVICFCKSLNEKIYFDKIGTCNECNKDYHICPLPGCLGTFLASRSRDHVKDSWFADFNDHLRKKHNAVESARKRGRIGKISKTNKAKLMSPLSIQSESKTLVVGSSSSLSGNENNKSPRFDKSDIVINPTINTRPKTAETGDVYDVLQKARSCLLMPQPDMIQAIQLLTEAILNAQQSGNGEEESVSLSILRTEKELLSKDANIDEIMGKVIRLEIKIEEVHSDIGITQEIRGVKTSLLKSKDKIEAVRYLEQIRGKIDSAEQSNKKRRIIVTAPVELDDSVIPLSLSLSPTLVNKKKKIDELERDFRRKEEEIKTDKLNNLKYEGEIVKTENDESQKQEREKLGIQIKEGDIKLKILNDELDTLKEHLNEGNKDTNGNSSISATHSSFSTHNSSNGLHSKDLIKIPTTLQQIRTDRCELMESIGDGGNSIVFKLKTRKRGSTENEFAAFKRFNFITSSMSPDDIEKAEKEIKFLSELEHPNIIKIIGAIGDPDARDMNNKPMGIGIVMEYCENGSLRSLLNKNNNKLDIRNIGIRLLLGAAQGLECLHTHTPTPIAHGDIKSDNILVDGDYTAKLGDFGISKLVYSANSAPTILGGKGVGGTIVYQAPETFDGPLGLKSDVYSFGCVILEMLTGERPWNRVGNNLASIVTKILVNKEKHDYSKITIEAMRDCSELVKLMKSCLNYNKEERPTIKEVREELEKIINPFKGFSSHEGM